MFFGYLPICGLVGNTQDFSKAVTLGKGFKSYLNIQKNQNIAWSNCRISFLSSRVSRQSPTIISVQAVIVEAGVQGRDGHLSSNSVSNWIHRPLYTTKLLWSQRPSILFFPYNSIFSLVNKDSNSQQLMESENKSVVMINKKIWSLCLRQHVACCRLSCPDLATASVYTF